MSDSADSDDDQGATKGNNVAGRFGLKPLGIKDCCDVAADDGVPEGNVYGDKTGLGGLEKSLDEVRSS